MYSLDPGQAKPSGCQSDHPAQPAQPARPASVHILPFAHPRGQRRHPFVEIGFRARSVT